MSTIKLSEITKSVDDELKAFNHHFSKSLKSKVGLVDLVTKYILKQKGKKIRPLLVLLSANLCGTISERTYRGATLVELLHTATLVHDDVVDNADKRRGFPSINAVWKNKIAVLMGDYLLARGLMISVDGNDFDFLKVITDTVKRMSEGELLQISKTRKLNIDEETYFRIISDKTASLLETCCKIGAQSATKDENKIEAMRRYGEYLGLAFQIRDDVLDFVGSSKLLGKSPGADIKEKKLTLPLIHALKSSTEGERKHIISLVKESDKQENINEVINFINRYQGIEYAEAKAKEFSENAKLQLDKFDDSESKKSLENLINFVSERKK